jgi:hypothetical protein
MARYILSTLDAVAGGDISVDDASYSLSVHVLSGPFPRRAPPVLDRDLQHHLTKIVHAVALGNLAAVTASRYLIVMREKLEWGLPLAVVIKGLPDGVTGVAQNESGSSDDL